MADALERELATWLAKAAVDDAVAERLHERVLRQLAVEEATFLGLCLDLAEARRPLLVRTTFRRVHRCTIAAVATDFLALRTEGHEAILVHVGAVGSIRSAPEAGAFHRPAAGSRRPPVLGRFVDILTGLAADRPRVRLAVDGETEILFGRLRGCGVDVVSVALGDDQPVPTWIPLRSILELELIDER